MTTSLSDGRLTNHTLEVNGKHFETVDNFIYLGSQVNSDNNIGEEVRRRVTIGNRSYYSQTLLVFERRILRSIFGGVYKGWRRIVYP